jgi:predicted O-methyltransferase YrrM
VSAVPPARAAAVWAHARRVRGFLSEEEGAVLSSLSKEAACTRRGPIVEIGSYQGRSTLFLAAGVLAAREAGASKTLVLAVDHHRGSEEMQVGWEHHDPALVDPATGRMDSLPLFRANCAAAGVEDVVVALVGDSAALAAYIADPLGLVFIDGGHGAAVTWADYRSWGPKLACGGLLAFHDVYPDPADGGRPPYECYRDALASGHFVEREAQRTGSLRVLERTVA